MVLALHIDVGMPRVDAQIDHSGPIQPEIGTIHLKESK